MNEDRLFGLYFAICAILGLAVTIVGIWAIVTVVQWLVTK